MKFKAKYTGENLFCVFIKMQKLNSEYFQIQFTQLRKIIVKE